MLNNQYYGFGNKQQQQEGWGGEVLMCVDQWDWKTDAPEFVPSASTATTGNIWKAVPGAPVDQGANHQVGPQAQVGAGASGGSQDAESMQTWVNQLEIQTAQIRAQWEVERRSLLRQIAHYRAVLDRYYIPYEEPCDSTFSGNQNAGPEPFIPAFKPSLPSQWGSAAASGSLGPGRGSPVGPQGGPGTQAAAPGGFRQNGFAAPANGGAHGGAANFMGSQCGQGGSAAASFNSPTAWLARGTPNDRGAGAASSLDSKMRQLNNLLQEGNTQQRRRSSQDSLPNGGNSEGRAENGPSSRPDAPDSHAEGDPGGSGGYSSGAIASTLRAMFPHATIRTSDIPDEQEGEEGLSPEALVEQRLRKLERSVGEQVDSRALRIFRHLGPQDAMEALAKVDETVHNQGGHCRNISSILQSVCQKIGRGAKKAQRSEEAGGSGSAGGPARKPSKQGSEGSGAGGPGGVPRSQRSRRARQLDEDGDAFDAGSDSDDFGERYGVGGRSAPADDHDRDLLRTNSIGSESSAKLNTPAGRRSNRSWADIQSGDEEDPMEDGPEGVLFTSTPLLALEQAGGCLDDVDEEQEHWTPRRVEKAARRGFELRRRGSSWDLKISMGGLEPPLTEAGMERYCRWLRVRLSSFREEHGASCLHRCEGEVDFSHNNMSNQMIWMLLETLAQHEVHAASLKLFANCISQGGVLAICEFVRMNERAAPIQELHLSHNEIDDESVLELLRTLHFQRPRYPPKLVAEGTGEAAFTPVWLRLNQNRVRDPEAVRRVAEEEGITICTAQDRNACKASHCCQRECPLVHLFNFDAQAHTRPRREGQREGGRAASSSPAPEGSGEAGGDAP